MDGTDELSLALRVEGALAGLIIGEALGAPLHSLKAGHILQIAGAVEDYVDAEAVFAQRPGRWMPAGLHGAAGQLALMMTEALFIGDDPAAEFGSLIERALEAVDATPWGLLRDPSPELKAALRSLSRAEPPSTAQAPEAVAAVALAPIALQAAVRSSELDMEMALRAVAMLSGNGEAQAAAVAFAQCLLLGLHGDLDQDPGLMAALRDLRDLAASIESRLALEDGVTSSLVGILPGLLKERNDDLARRSIAAEASRHSPDHALSDPQQPFAPANVAWAMYLALRERKFDQPVAAAIQGGKETNTVAALCGCLAGARLGARTIPPAWRKGCLAAELADSRVRALLEDNPSIIYEIDLFELEEQWARLQREGRASRLRAAEDARARRDERQARKKPAQKTPPSPPPSTYARPGREFMPPPDPQDPEEARKRKAQRAKKRIGWKEDRKKDRRSRE